MPELTPEMRREAARRNGVSEDEVQAQWDQLQALHDQGGYEKIRQEAIDAILDTERDVVELVASARSYMDDEPDDRAMGMAHFYYAITEETEGVQLDTERILQYLALAVWKLAEAQDREAALLDGSRRTPKEEKK